MCVWVICIMSVLLVGGKSMRNILICQSYQPFDRHSLRAMEYRCVISSMWNDAYMGKSC